MKTEIAYPNGIKIVIEHPDVLEAVESKETIEAIDVLTKENNALKFEVELLQSEKSLLQTLVDAGNVNLNSTNKNYETLRDALLMIKSNLSEEKFKQLAFINHGSTMNMLFLLDGPENKAENKKGIFEFQGNGNGGISKEYTGTIDQVTPLKKQREYKSRNCDMCGKSFVPTGPRGNVCDDCKPQPTEKAESEENPEQI